MTQANTPTWCFTFQQKLMAALDAVWAILEYSDDPAEIRQARDKAKAIGDLAAMARKVALMIPTPRGKPRPAEADTAETAATSALDDLDALMAAMPPPPAPPAPVAAQAKHTRRALDKLKGGRRGRP